MEEQRILKPITEQPDYQIYYGFDIETEVDSEGRHHFLCAAIVNEEHGYKKVFRCPKKCLKEIIRLKRDTGCHIVATNLHFDIFELFKPLEEKQYLDPRFRRGRLLYARYPYREHKGKSYRNDQEHVLFTDTMNFLLMGVEKLGDKFLKLPKLPKPSFLARRPQSIQEWAELEMYNVRDALISQQTMQRLHDLLYYFRNLCQKRGIPLPYMPNQLTTGSKLKYTGAASSLDNYRRIFQTRTFKVATNEELADLFQAYYGGRCEVFYRGKISNAQKRLLCYDVNSMYPYVMKQYDYPDPDSMELRRQMTFNDLELEGVCYATVHCPEMNIPFLPKHVGDRLCFPTGVFSGWWTTMELRYAITIGYEIISLGKGYVFTKVCQPFVHYVNAWYELRQQFKKEGSPLEEGAKLFMNSLYGRFALGADIERQVIHAKNMTIERCTFFEQNGWEVYQPSDSSEWFYVEKPSDGFANDIIPIWSIYCTAYARRELYKYMKITEKSLIYVDTDSITCSDPLPTSTELGGLKLEKEMRELIVVRPKMYGYTDMQSKTNIKVKGLPSAKGAESLAWLEELLERKQATYQQFMRFGITQRMTKKKLEPNQIQQLTKMFDCEDIKRRWPGAFSLDSWQSSRPQHIEEV